MSNGEHRKLVPTSEELERQGAVAPLGTSAAEGRRAIFAFLRVGRIRVRPEVAARKNVAAERHNARLAAAPAADPSLIAPSTATFGADSVVEPHQTASGTNDAVTEASAVGSAPLTPRRIRIDPSVRERRGRGTSDPQL